MIDSAGFGFQAVTSDSYEYDKAPADIYRRQDRCRCIVTFDAADGRRNIVHSGTEGKRSYTKDQYGGYELTEDAKAAKRAASARTEADRKKAAREKRITTWQAKKADTSGITGTKYAPSKQRNVEGIQVSHVKYARLTGVMNTRYPGLSPNDGNRTIYDAKYGYVIQADGFGGLTIRKRFKL